MHVQICYIIIALELDGLSLREKISETFLGIFKDNFRNENHCIHVNIFKKGKIGCWISSNAYL